jgi:hypothetical protein
LLRTIDELSERPESVRRVRHNRDPLICTVRCDDAFLTGCRRRRHGGDDGFLCFTKST